MLQSLEFLFGPRQKFQEVALIYVMNNWFATHLCYISLNENLVYTLTNVAPLIVTM